MKPSSEWFMHADIYQAYPEVQAIVHAHADACTALACLGVIDAFASVRVGDDPSETGVRGRDGRLRGGCGGAGEQAGGDDGRAGDQHVLHLVCPSRDP